MRLVINDHLGMSGSVQLARALAARGHEVLYLYCADLQPPKPDLQRQAGDPAGFTVKGLGIGRPVDVRSLMGHWRDERNYAALLSRAVLDFRPDLILAGHNPLLVQRRLQSACLRAGIAFVYWMQEVRTAAIDRLLIGRSTFADLCLSLYARWLERHLLVRSRAVIAVHEWFLTLLNEDWGIDPRQCMVVRNWVPLDQVRPGPKDNAWSRAHDLADKTVVLFSGPLTEEPDPLVLTRLAAFLADRPDTMLAVVSEGAGADLVARDAAARGLQNIRVLPFEPYEKASEVLASADILLGILSDAADVALMPATILSYLCAGRAIIASAPGSNVAALTVRLDAGGTAVTPGHDAALTDAVRHFLDDVEARQIAGDLARAYAERAFDIDVIAGRFDRLFDRLVSGTPRHPANKSYLSLLFGRSR